MAPLTDLVDAVAPELDWELAEAIPLLRESLSTEDLATLFCSARYVNRHAPARLSENGTRWYVRAVWKLRRSSTIVAGC